MIIGFTGKKKNGKSTICQMIHTHLTKFYGKVVSTQINFKDPLYEMARSIGWNGVKDDKGRLLLQRLGTDVVRECIDMDFWVKKWKMSIIQSWDKFQVILTDDIRFENEASVVKSFHGYIVYIDTPIVNQAYDPHASEKGIDPGFFDLILDNIKYGDEALEQCAEKVINEFKLYHL